MAIDPDEFADLVVRRATLRRVWPEYLAAVAMVRSEIKDSDTPLGFGPFGLTKAQWDTELKDPELATLATLEAAVPGQIKQWRHQVNVFTLMTAKAQAALMLKNLDGKFSLIELYNAQWASQQVTSDQLNKALEAVAPSIRKALDNVGSDVQATIDSTLLLAGGAGGILGELISKGEGDYNSFNRGKAGDAHGQKIDFSQMTLAAIMQEQAKDKNDPTRLFAVGKYQVVPRHNEGGASRASPRHFGTFHAARSGEHLPALSCRVEAPADTELHHRQVERPQRCATVAGPGVCFRCRPKHRKILFRRGRRKFILDHRRAVGESPE
jgi:hypothetical protein